MIWLYRMLYLPGLLLALPYYLMRMWRRGGYGKDFQHRFGRFRRLRAPAEGKTRIWLQAVSVGELLAIGPLVESLCATGRCEIVLTTTTSTGYVEAKKRYSERVLAIGIFPLDFWLFSRCAWKRIQPDAIILTESELWPEHLHRARVLNIPAFLVNARISDRSFKRYERVPQLTRRLLKKFSGIYAASETDRSRLEQLGAPPDKLHSFGSIKLDVRPPRPLAKTEKAGLEESLGFNADGNKAPLIILGASTWPGEESALIRITNRMAAIGYSCRLLLVPRHAERAPEIIAELKKQALPWHQRSTGVAPTSPIYIHLADTTGELSRLTQLADIAFIGKSLPPNKGGQTPIDAAGLGVPLIFGPNMSNFRDIATALLEARAAIGVENEHQLEAAVEELIDSIDKRREMSEAGQTWHSANRGSSDRIAQSISGRLLQR